MKLTHLGIIAGACITLGGCAAGFGTRTIIEKQYTQYNVPEEKFECKVIASFPKPKGVTDRQVADLINQLYRDNKQCYFSMQSLKAYLRKADAEGRVNLTPAFLKKLL